MKKIFIMAFAAISMVACNDSEGNNTRTDTEGVEGTGTTTNTTASGTGTTDNTTPATSATTTTTTGTYTPAEGDVTYRENKVRVMRNGTWVDADNDVKLDNGVVVRRNGKVTRDGKEIELKDGEVVNRAGNFFDKSGRAIENAWDKTKEGVKEAGKAVGNAAKKVGEKAKDVVDNDNN